MQFGRIAVDQSIDTNIFKFNYNNNRKAVFVSSAVINCNTKILLNKYTSINNNL